MNRARLRLTSNRFATRCEARDLPDITASCTKGPAPAQRVAQTGLLEGLFGQSRVCTLLRAGEITRSPEVLLAPHFSTRPKVGLDLEDEGQRGRQTDAVRPCPGASWSPSHAS